MKDIGFAMKMAACVMITAAFLFGGCSGEPSAAEAAGHSVSEKGEEISEEFSLAGENGKDVGAQWELQHTIPASTQDTQKEPEDSGKKKEEVPGAESANPDGQERGEDDAGAGEKTKAGTEDSLKVIMALEAGAAVDGDLTDGLKEHELEACFYYEEIQDDVFERMKGKSFQEDCTVPRADLRYVRFLHHGFDGEIHVGELVVNQAIASDIRDIFLELYEEEYPIEKAVLIDEYDADDEASMRDNNTSCFNFRVIAGSKSLSNHALGLAVDINPLYNPYVKAKNGTVIVQPETASEYTDRKANCAYYISEDDICCKAFVSRGFSWGGNWKSLKDYQHFER